MNEQSEFMTIQDFCQRFRVSRSTVYRQVNAGALPILKIGRSTRIPASGARQWAQNLEGQA
jgi:excisionase family DNA binding protein